ncbi:MAG: hypothetical protein QNJ94_04335 [Alphaproteobacteria bacterium]|nr:hypothetical protein [Alphaproteobacteria bacterium]
MHRIPAALAATLLLTAPTHATEIAQGSEIEAMFKGSNVHRNARDGSGVRFDLWRLSPDGSFAGSYRIEKPITRGEYWQEGHVSGTWRVQNGQLCVEGRGLEDDGRICFDVRRDGGSREYVATNAATGFSWQMFVYPHRNG